LASILREEESQNPIPLLLQNVFYRERDLKKRREKMKTFRSNQKGRGGKQKVEVDKLINARSFLNLGKRGSFQGELH
jgi:hypothetical protein